MTDNFSTLNSNTLKDLCKLLNITKRNIIAYNPNANSAERSNRDILQILRAITSEKPDKWANHLSSTNLALNSTVNRVTKYSPGFLFLGRPLRLHRRLLMDDPLDNFSNLEDQIIETENYGAEIAKNMQHTFNIANKNIDGHLQYRIKEYKENDSKDYQEGKLVVIFQPNKPTTGIVSKLTSAYSLSFKITKRISPVCYELTSMGWTTQPFKVVISYRI